MFYGLYNSKAISRFLLTRNNVLGEDNQTPWLTTSKEEANQTLGSLSAIYQDIAVVSVSISADVPWKFEEHRM